MTAAGIACAQDVVPPVAAASSDAISLHASVYWQAVTDKRKLRHSKRQNGQAIDLDDYVLAQPPAGEGVPEMGDPRQAARPDAQKYVPTVLDFVQSASKTWCSPWSERRPPIAWKNSCRERRAS